MKNIKRLFKIISVGFVALSAFGPLQAGDAITELQKAGEGRCSSGLLQSYEKALAPMLSSLPDDENLLGAISSVIPVACDVNLPDWRLQMSFSLGHYALVQGLSAASVSELTRLTSSAPVGKEFYVAAGRVYEKTISAKVSNAEAGDVLQGIIAARLKSAQMEAYALIYLRERNDGKDHAQALASANEALPRLRRNTNLERLKDEFSLPGDAWEEFQLSAARKA